MAHRSEPVIRPFRPDDAPALLELFRETVRRVNVRDYTPEQVRAWAPDEIDGDAWAARFEGRYVAVVELDGRIAGFADLEPDGHLDRLFVSADFQRRSVGRTLLEAVQAEARRLGLERVFAEVSITARPLFESQGFVVLEPQTVVARGVEFRNYRMERRLVE